MNRLVAGRTAPRGTFHVRDHGTPRNTSVHRYNALLHEPPHLHSVSWTKVPI
jgi:hypothetical protein